MINIKNLVKYACALTVAMALGSANASLVSVDITGTTLFGDEFGDSNSFNLTENETILATAVFDDSALAAGINLVTFAGSNTLTINVNGTIYTQNDDAAASLKFENGLLTDFDFLANDGSFNSSFLFFDDFSFLLGEWEATVTVTAVPVPAAIWLFGAGLLSLTGIARRNIARR